MSQDPGNRLRASWARTWNRRPRFKQTTWVVLIVASISLGVAAAVFVARRTELDLGVSTYPPFTTQETPWSTIGPTPPSRSSQASGATSIPTPTTTSQLRTKGSSGRRVATTRTITTSASTTGNTTPATTTTQLSTPDPTDLPTSTLPTGTTSTDPEPTGASQ